MALDESAELTRRSQSSVDIRRGDDDDAPQIERSQSPDQLPEPLKVEATRRSRPRARLPNLRRRSTLEWAHASSQQRQTRLQQLVESRLVNVFFSLHVDRVDQPVYISEVVEDTMNPDFCHIDLDPCGPCILRADTVLVKVWVKRSDSDYSCSLQSEIHLRHLTYLGKKLAQYRHALPQNCILLELTDGLYVAWAKVAAGGRQQAPSLSTDSTTDARRNLPVSSSFDALLRLSKLDDSIQDALVLRQNLETDLERMVESNNAPLADADRLQQKTDFLKTVEYAQTRLQKQLQALRKSRDTAKESLVRKRQLLETGRSQHLLPPVQSDEASQPKTKADLQASISQQRRRICETLQRIYPIAPIPNRPLSFTIRGLHLPNSEDLEGASPEQVAGALGYVAHAVQLLAFYLSQPLPYPVFPRSGTSTIHDPISVMGVDVTKGGSSNTSTQSAAAAAKQGPRMDAASRIFPLYPRGVPRFRFEYAVFLLNKNIELLLSNVYRVRVLDIRQTLPNLLYVLYCATAGEGELPARKAGGIRGLLKTGRASLGGSARDDDSVASADAEDEMPIQSFRFGSQAGRKRGSKLLRADGKGTL